MQSNEVSTQFPFTRLPKELRLLVWEATFEPQFILLRHVEGRQPRSPLPVFAFKPYDDPKSPIALQVCQESRAFGLEHYRRWTLRWYLHDQIARSKVVCNIVFMHNSERLTNSQRRKFSGFRMSRALFVFPRTSNTNVDH